MQGRSVSIFCRGLLSLCVAGAVLADFRGASADELDALKGKTIRFIIGGSPNGGTDLYSRPLVAGLKSVLPETSVSAQNMDKSGVVIQELGSASGSVVTLATLPNSPIYNQIVDPGAGLDLRTLKWIGAITSNHRIGFIRKSLGVKTLAEAKGLGRQLIALTGPASSANYFDTLLVSIASGLKVKVVPGFEEEQRMAMLLAGDADFVFTNYFDVRALADSGDLVPIFRINEHGYPPQFDDVPVLKDVAPADAPREIIASMEQLNLMGRLMAASPSTDDATVAALRTAFSQALALPDVMEDYRKGDLLPAPTDGDKLAAWIDALLSAGDASKQIKATIDCAKAISEGTASECPK
jgi:tripartite-type tricarboxylate transporter receptor subunit TctC